MKNYCIIILFLICGIILLSCGNKQNKCPFNHKQNKSKCPFNHKQNKSKCPFNHKIIEGFDANNYVVPSSTDSDSIPCPMMFTLYNEGFIIPDNNGDVTVSGENTPGTLEYAMKTVLGLAHDAYLLYARAPSFAAGREQGRPSGKFNLFTLADTSLDTVASTGIRDNTMRPDGMGGRIILGDKIKPDELNTLVSFSERPDERIYPRDFGRIAEYSMLRDSERIHGGLEQPAKQYGEYIALFQIFGRRDENGNFYFLFDDLKKIFLEGRFPTGWVFPPKNTLRLANYGLYDEDRTFFNLRKRVENGLDNCHDLLDRDSCENTGLHEYIGCKWYNNNVLTRCKYNQGNDDHVQSLIAAAPDQHIIVENEGNSSLISNAHQAWDENVYDEHLRDTTVGNLGNSLGESIRQGSTDPVHETWDRDVYDQYLRGTMLGNAGNSIGDFASNIFR